jgi:hypothetical protein
MVMCGAGRKKGFNIETASADDCARAGTRLDIFTIAADGKARDTRKHVHTCFCTQYDFGRRARAQWNSLPIRIRSPGVTW